MAGLGLLSGLGGLFGGLTEGSQLFRRNRWEDLQYKQALQEMAAQQLIGQSAAGIGNLGSETVSQDAASADAIARQRAAQSMFQPAPQAPPAPPDLSRLQNEIWKLESGGRMEGVPNSSAGAVGPMQIMPGTAAGYGVGMQQLQNPQTNLGLGRRITSDLYNRYGGDPLATLAGYNAGPGRADQFVRAGDNPAVLPPETQNYLRKAEQDLSIGQRDQASNAAVGAAGMMPPQLIGRATPSFIARLVDQVAGSNAPPEVKGAAMIKLLPLMSQEGKQQFQQMFEMYKFGTEHSEKQQEFGIRMQEMEAGRAQARQLAEERLSQSREMGQERMDIAKENLQLRKDLYGVGEEGGAQAAAKIPDKWEGSPDKAPPGVPQAIWNGALAYVQTGQMPSLGMQPGLRNQIMQVAPSAMQALGIKPSEAPKKWAEYGGQKHAEYTLGTRVANLATGIFEASQAASAVVDTSRKVGRTDLGPFFNRAIVGARLESGDPNVVQFQDALNTFLNAYTRAINPTGRLTDQQQRHAYETLSTAMSQGQVEAGVEQLLKELDYMKQGLGLAVGEVPEYFRAGGEPKGTPAANARQTGPAIEQIEQMPLPDLLNFLERPDLSIEQRRAIDARLKQLQPK